MARNTSALGGFTPPGQVYFCIRRVYTSWPGILLLYEGLLYLARNNSLYGRECFCLIGGFFPYQEWKIPGNPETPEIFLPRKSLISDILDTMLGAGIFLKFLTVRSLNFV
jgi:hypothetical protein